MKLSKLQIMELDHTQAISVGVSQLNSDKQKWIAFKNYPEYNSIVKEYENDKTKNKKLKCPQDFPSRGKWKPSYRQFASHEQDLLCGPSPNITLLK